MAPRIRAGSKADPLVHLEKLRSLVDGMETANKNEYLQSLDIVVSYVNQARTSLADQAMLLLESARKEKSTHKTCPKSFSEAVQAKSILQSAVKSATLNKSVTVVAKSMGVASSRPVQDLVSDILSKVKPRELGVRVTKFGNSRNAVFLTSEKDEDAQILMQAIEQKISHVTATTERKLKPRVVLRSVSINTKDEDLLDDLIASNFGHLNAEEVRKRIRLVHRIKYGKREPSNFCSVILEMDAELRNRLIKEQKGWAYFDFVRLRCYDSLHFRHCWKCQSFKHSAAGCTEEPACSKCGREHLTTRCPQQTSSCHKCLQSEHDHRHKFASPDCTTAALARAAFARRIDYGSK